MIAEELTTILAFVLVHCWFTRRTMGITNFVVETPEYWKTWSAIPVVALRRRNCGWKRLGDWKTAAMNIQRCYECTADFCSFIFES